MGVTNKVTGIAAAMEPNSETVPAPDVGQTVNTIRDGGGGRKQHGDYWETMERKTGHKKQSENKKNQKLFVS